MQNFQYVEIDDRKNSINMNKTLNVSSHTVNVREQETHKQYIKYLMFYISIEPIQIKTSLTI